MKEIQLNKQGKNKGKYKAIVDNDVFEEVNKYNWYYRAGYASRSDYSTSKQKTIQLHRYIWELKYGKIPKRMLVDHKDRDPLNCRISNLRLVTQTENNRNASKRKTNTSGYIGVSKQAYWNCQWQDDKGNCKSKRFSFDNVGKTLAARYYDLMVTQIRRNYTGELNFQSLAEYQHTLKQAILKDIESN